MVLGGKEYAATAVDLARVTIGECRVIKRETGMTIAQWRERFLAFDEDPDVYATMVFLMRSRAGEQVDWAEIDSIPLAELMAGFSVVTDEPSPNDDSSPDGDVTIPSVTPDLALADRGA